MKVLIVEDSQAKAGALSRAVEDAGLSEDSVTIIPNIVQAKECLQKATFDAMLLDLQIPKRFGDKSDKTGGMDLLRWIQRHPAKHSPAHIVAVTGYELEVEAGTYLNSLGIPVIQYSPSKDGWQTYITGLIKRLLLASAGNSVEHQSEGVYAVVLTTVDVEYDQAKRVFGAHGPGEIREAVNWHKVQLHVDDEKVFVVLAQSSQMGMPAAAVLTGKAIRLWNPQLLIMAGVCAGVREEVAIGDIVVPEHCWDYGSGKLTDAGILRPDPHPVDLREPMRALLRSVVEEDLLEAWRKDWPGSKPNTLPRLHIKPAASGAAVVADNKTVADVKQQSRKVVGIDMENYGFYFAVTNSGQVREPRFCAAKAVVDFADSHKADQFQEYGAHLSARLAKWLIERDFGKARG